MTLRLMILAASSALALQPASAPARAESHLEVVFDEDLTARASGLREDVSRLRERLTGRDAKALHASLEALRSDTASIAGQVRKASSRQSRETAKDISSLAAQLERLSKQKFDSADQQTLQSWLISIDSALERLTILRKRPSR